MKLLENIPIEKYDDIDYISNYLNTHKTIGNEETVEYNGIWHIHWRGPLDNDKVILQLKSVLATQQVEKIFFWIEDNIRTFTSPGYIKLIQFKKYIDVKVFDKSIMMQASGDRKILETIWSYYNRYYPDYRYKSDILRWIVLDIYGGVQIDADNFLLRDFTDIKINNWSAKWPHEPYGECSCLKIQKGEKRYEQIYLNNPNNPNCFIMLYPPKFRLEAFNFKYENLTHTVLPTPFFDMVFSKPTPEFTSPALSFANLRDFFKPTEKDITMDNFFKGCFDCHWHNGWDAPELKNSYAGRLNKHLDEIIEAKYGIKPYKIFQG
jgi:hypothetical protein